MKPARIPWETLLEIVKANRDKHIETYRAAYCGWLEQVHAALMEKTLEFDDAIHRLDSVLSGEILRSPTFDSPPRNHVKEYERFIRMVELTDEAHIELEEHEFSQYVDDEWHWKQDFVLSATKYGAIK